MPSIKHPQDGILNPGKPLNILRATYSDGARTSRMLLCTLLFLLLLRIEPFQERRANSSDNKTRSFSTSRQRTISNRASPTRCLETLSWRDGFDAELRRDALVSHSKEPLDKGAGWLCTSNCSGRSYDVETYLLEIAFHR